VLNIKFNAGRQALMFFADIQTVMCSFKVMYPLMVLFIGLMVPLLLITERELKHAVWFFHDVALPVVVVNF
jgi:hypothetical protein